MTRGDMPDWAKAKESARETDGFASTKALAEALRARLFGAKGDAA